MIRIVTVNKLHNLEDEVERLQQETALLREELRIERDRRLTESLKLREAQRREKATTRDAWVSELTAYLESLELEFSELDSLTIRGDEGADLQKEIQSARWARSQFLAYEGQVAKVREELRRRFRNTLADQLQANHPRSCLIQPLRDDRPEVLSE
jgi:hypothetical protein